MRNDYGIRNMSARKAARGGGKMSTARKDMASGYYKDDMGMRGGAMYKKVAKSVRKNKVTKLEKMSLLL